MSGANPGIASGALRSIRRGLEASGREALDLADRLLGRRDPLTPPRRLVHAVGGMDFHDVGRHLLAIAVERSGLAPNERILDVGCGVGRLAVPLTGYLDSGEYLGFDISRPAIRWCRAAIGSRHPNFQFVLADVANSHYNPKGAVAPEAYRFPCADRSVDLVFAASIFTHLSPHPADRYLAECARVLKPGGRAALSFFLLDAPVTARLGDFWPKFTTFPEPFYAVENPQDPEAAIAYSLEAVTEALARHGYANVEISRGSWSFHPGAASFQDFVFCRKQ